MTPEMLLGMKLGLVLLELILGEAGSIALVNVVFGSTGKAGNNNTNIG